MTHFFSFFFAWQNTIWKIQYNTRVRLRPPPVACPRSHLQKRMIDRGYAVSPTVSPDFLLTGIVTPIACVFSTRFSSLQILRNSPRCHSAIMLLFCQLWSVTNLSLLFGFCAACMLSHRCLKTEWWAAVTVVAIPSQPALLMRLYASSARLSVLSPVGRASWSTATLITKVLMDASRRVHSWVTCGWTKRQYLRFLCCSSQNVRLQQMPSVSLTPTKKDNLKKNSRRHDEYVKNVVPISCALCDRYAYRQFLYI